MKKLSALTSNGLIYVIIGNFLNKAITMISSVVIARIVLKNDYAFLTYSDTLYGYISLFTGAGTAASLLKYCSDRRYEECSISLLRYSTKVGCLFNAFLGITLCLIISITDIPFTEARIYIWASVLYPSLLHISESMLSFLRAKLQIKTYAIVNILQAICICILSIGFAMLVGTFGYVYARYITVLFLIAVEYKYIKPFIVNGQQAEIDKPLKSKFWMMAISLMVANAFSGMMPINESFLISTIIKDETVTANFRVAGMFPQMVLLLTSAVNIAFFPVISRIENKLEAKRKIIEIGVVNAVVIVLIVSVGILLSPWLICSFYGEKYRDAVEISYLLWIMRGINAAFRMVPMNMLPAIEKPKFNAYLAMVSCAVQVALDYYFINCFGITGVAYGTIVVYVLSGAIFWIYLIAVCNRSTIK